MLDGVWDGMGGRVKDRDSTQVWDQTGLGMCFALVWGTGLGAGLQMGFRVQFVIHPLMGDKIAP